MTLPITITWTDIDLTLPLVGPFKGSTGNYYVFGACDTNTRRLHAHKSADPSTSWISGAEIAITNNWPTRYMSGYQVGDIVHIIIGTSGSATLNDTRYFTFNLATENWVVTNEAISVNHSQTGAYGVKNDVSLVVRSNGEVVALFNGAHTKTSGNFCTRIYYSRRTGTNTWTAATLIEAAAADEKYWGRAVLGAGDIVHCFWADATGGLTDHRSLSAANALQTVTPYTAVFGQTNVISYPSGGVTKVNVVANSSNSGYFDSANVPTLNSNTTTTFGTVVRLFNDGSTIYALYREATTSDLYIKSSTDFGATWSTGVAVFVGTVGAAWSTLSLDGKIYQRGSDIVIPYVVNDNGTLKYNEYLVRTLSQDAWDSGDKSAAVALTNNDKTATGIGYVRSTQTRAHGTAGKYYVEFSFASSPNFVGMESKSVALSDITTLIYVMMANGNIVIGSPVAGMGAVPTASDILCMAWDAGAKKIWFRLNNGIWNGNASNNPATDTGGLSTASMGLFDYALWISNNSSADAVTIRTEAAELTQTTPSGFLSWMGETLTVDPNVTVALTTNLVTASVGDETVTTTRNVSTALTTNLATVSVGTATAGVFASVTLTTNLATVSVGDVTVATTRNVGTTLTTNLATSAVGGVTVAAVRNVSTELATNLATVSVGTATAVGRISASTALTTNLVTASVGDETVTTKWNISTALATNLATMSAGTATAAGVRNVSTALTTNLATVSVGDVTVSTATRVDVSVALATNLATVSVGDPTVTAKRNISTALTTNLATASVGTASATAVQNVSTGLTTNLATVSHGTVSATAIRNASAGLTTNLATVSVGDETVSTTRSVSTALDGQEIAVVTGGVSISAGGAISVGVSGVVVGVADPTEQVRVNDRRAASVEA